MDGAVMDALPVGSVGEETTVSVPRLMEPPVGVFVVVHESVNVLVGNTRTEEVVRAHVGFAVFSCWVGQAHLTSGPLTVGPTAGVRTPRSHHSYVRLGVTFAVSVVPTCPSARTSVVPAQYQPSWQETLSFVGSFKRTW